MDTLYVQYNQRACIVVPLQTRAFNRHYFFLLSFLSCPLLSFITLPLSSIITLSFLFLLFHAGQLFLVLLLLD